VQGGRRWILAAKWSSLDESENAMKHAGDAALAALEDVLRGLRALEGLTEKKRGAFYRKSSAFLHFHEDPAGLFADVHDGTDWKRFPLNTVAERKRFLQRVRVLARLT
jgi:hypothetical protein